MSLYPLETITVNIKNYWNNKIIEWEDSMKEGSNVSFIERLASYFRNPVKLRAEMCMNILKQFVNNKTVLELGCGSGSFAFKLYDLGKTKHITGVDISSNAIKRAQRICMDKNIMNAFTFLEGDVISTTLPETDITIGLGLLDYLTLEEITLLFNNMRSKYFLFTFSEERVLLLRYAHILYLWLQKCPKHFYYTKNEIADCIGNKHGKVQFLNDKRMSFGCIVHNLALSKANVLPIS